MRDKKWVRNSLRKLSERLGQQGFYVRSIDGAPHKSGCFFFDQLLDAIELLAHEPPGVTIASMRIESVVTRLPHWRHAVRKVLGFHYAQSMMQSKARHISGLQFKRRFLSQEELNSMAADHKRWLQLLKIGIMADFSYSNLYGLNLDGFDLRYANFWFR